MKPVRTFKFVKEGEKAHMLNSSKSRLFGSKLNEKKIEIVLP